MKKFLKKKLKGIKPDFKKFASIFIAVVLFLALIGLAFSISILFGAIFIFGFVLSIYKRDLERKAWKPVAIFVGALITRFAIEQYAGEIITSTTLWDLIVSVVVFGLIFLIGWSIKRS